MCKAVLATYCYIPGFVIGEMRGEGGGGSSEFSGGGGGGEGLKSIHGGNMGVSSQEKGEYLVSAICTML